MMYMIKRGDQEFGPYSGNDIQQYLSSGNIVETDMVRAEGSDRWLAVKDILAKKAGGAGPQPATPAPQPSYNPAPAPQPMADPMFDSAPAPQPMADFGAPAPSWGAPAASYGSAPDPAMGGGFGAAAAGAMGAATAGGPAGAMKNGAPLPPGMNWILVLVLALFTCGIFGFVYLFIQAGWVQKIDPQSKGKKFLTLMLAAYGLVIGLIVVGAVITAMAPDSFIGPMISILSPIGNLAFLVLYILGVFNMRTSLEGYFNAVEPINLKLNPILTFFFAIYYFQYHFNRITTWKTTGTLPQ